MSLTEKDAERIAHLARLAPQDATNMLDEFNNILDLFQQIETVDTQSVIVCDPLTLSIDHCRPDVVTEPSLSDELAAFAHYNPETQLIDVPKVIEE